VYQISYNDDPALSLLCNEPYWKGMYEMERNEKYGSRLRFHSVLFSIFLRVHLQQKKIEMQITFQLFCVILSVSYISNSTMSSRFIQAAAAAAILSQSTAIGMLPRICTSTVLNYIPDMWLSRPSVYNSKWPFQPGMRVRTKGWKGVEHELVLDHATQTLHYHGLSGSTPTEILTKMALNGVMPLSVARSNWSSIWVTDDDGDVNVLGKDLRQAFSIHNDHKLLERKRLDVPLA
jgi:hypothetical protein